MKVEEILKTSKPLSEKKRLVINLMLTTSEANTTVADALKAFDISNPQFNVLRILRGQKGKPANLSTIQDRMVNKMSNTTRLVDKLIEKKLVDRYTCEHNRRKVEIIITTNGLALLEKIDPVIESAEADIIQNLSNNEVKLLNELLEKMRG